VCPYIVYVYIGATTHKDKTMTKMQRIRAALNTFTSDCGDALSTGYQEGKRKEARMWEGIADHANARALTCHVQAGDMPAPLKLDTPKAVKLPKAAKAK
jgi:hypothetical protein